MGSGSSEEKPLAEVAMSGDRYTIEVSGLGVRFSCGAGESLLRAMMTAGHRSLAVGCRSGGCGVCRIQILAGDYANGHMTRSVISPDDEDCGLVLACRTYPRSDMTIAPRPIGRFAEPLSSGLAA